MNLRSFVGKSPDADLLREMIGMLNCRTPPITGNLAGMLKAAYDQLAHEPVPETFEAFLNQLEAKDSRRR